MTLERIYNVPLRKEWLKVPKYKRAEKAMRALKQFLAKHMKSDQIKIGKALNLELWKHGMKNPPHHIKVTASKDDKGVARAELFGAKVKEKKKSEKKKGKLIDKLKEAVTVKEEPKTS